MSDSRLVGLAAAIQAARAQEAQQHSEPPASGTIVAPTITASRAAHTTASSSRTAGSASLRSTSWYTNMQRKAAAYDQLSAGVPAADSSLADAVQSESALNIGVLAARATQLAQARSQDDMEKSAFPPTRLQPAPALPSQATAGRAEIIDEFGRTRTVPMASAAYLRYRQAQQQREQQAAPNLNSAVSIPSTTHDVAAAELQQQESTVELLARLVAAATPCPWATPLLPVLADSCPSPRPCPVSED